MKIRITAWTLSWDTDEGTDCRVFGSEAEWFTFFPCHTPQPFPGGQPPEIPPCSKPDT